MKVSDFMTAYITVTALNFFGVHKIKLCIGVHCGVHNVSFFYTKVLINACAG